MPLNEDDRVKIEDTIMDLHFTANKYIETGKDVHRKLLEVNVQEAIELLEAIRDDIVDDEKVYDYKMHFLLPFQIYELLKIREKAEAANDDNGDEE